LGIASVSGAQDWLPDAAVALLRRGRCPDCDKPGLIRGPRGGNAVNTACQHCGSEFNVGEHGGRVVMAHRNSVPGAPNVLRLRDVFAITLPTVSTLSAADSRSFVRNILDPPEPNGALRDLAEQYKAAGGDPYRDDTSPERACDCCGRMYRGPAVYCSLRCVEADR
jgi:hypothetical protein